MTSRLTVLMVMTWPIYILTSIIALFRPAQVSPDQFIGDAYEYEAHYIQRTKNKFNKDLSLAAFKLVVISVLTFIPILFVATDLINTL